jgi:hypothetical protein
MGVDQGRNSQRNNNVVSRSALTGETDRSRPGRAQDVAGFDGALGCGGRRPRRLFWKDKVIVPEVLVQSHSASLCMTFYTGEQYPREYRLDAFAAEHGSWNRSRRTGYKVIRVPLKSGKATGEYEDFLVGFVTPEGNVWGRPVGVTVAKDGALLVTDDGSGIVWRVAYTRSIQNETNAKELLDDHRPGVQLGPRRPGAASGPG